MAFLRRCGAVDDQPGTVVANQSIRCGEKHCFARDCIPNAADDMMKLDIDRAAPPQSASYCQAHSEHRNSRSVESKAV